MSDSDSELMFKPTPYEYYSQMRTFGELADTSFFTNVLERLTTELKALNINFYFIRWTEKIVNEGPEFEYEYFIEDLAESSENSGRIYVSERHLFWKSVNPDEPLCLHHHFPTHLIPQVNEMLFRHFPNRTRGFEHKDATIQIYLEPFQTRDEIPACDVMIHVYITVETPDASNDDINELLPEKALLSFSHGNEFYLEIPQRLLHETADNIKNKLTCEITYYNDDDELITL